MKSFKRVIPVLLAMYILLSFTCAGDSVRIIYNDKILTFDTVSPYFDSNQGRIYAPVRDLTEALGAEVNFNPNTKTVTIIRDNTVISLSIDKKTAIVNNVPVTLDAPAFIKDGSTFVPLRFVSENLLLDVRYDQKTSTVYLSDKKLLELGMSEVDSKALMGEPQRVDVTEKGYNFNVYNADLTQYTLVGIDNGIVTAYYIDSDNWILANGLRCGMAISDIETKYPSQNYGRTKTDSYEIFSGKDITTTIYLDKAGKSRAILIEKTEYSNKSRISAAVLDGFERELVDLVNTQRVRKGLSALTLDDELSAIAKTHSGDMAKNNFFSHEGSDGLSPTQRLDNAGYKNFYQLEIIAESYPNSLCAFSGHIILDDYIEVITASYKKIGVGVAYNAKSDGILYYNHLFYADKK